MEETRTLLLVSGTDARDFLQGLVTNDVNQVNQGLAYAAMLTPQGKYLADFFMLRADDDIILDVHADLAEDLQKRLAMYKLRADVAITRSDLVVSRGTGTAPKGAFADPRHPSLGWRLYSDTRLPDDGTDWNALRVAACVPASLSELGPDTYVLEAGFERMRGVSFTKGCYVGQEVTARMKHKTELRKGFATVTLSTPVPPGSEIVADGKPAGVIHTQTDGAAIAYLRFDRVRDLMTAGDATVTLP